jgi:hypothetical protein
MFELTYRAAHARRFLFVSLVSFVATLLLLLAGAREARADGPIDPKAIPEPLKPWTSWALYGKEQALCPTLDGVPDGAPGAGPKCAWPSRLELRLEEKSGSFSQSWHMDAKGWVPLPGDAKRWPLDVKVGNARALVVSRAGVPSVELDRGDHVVVGAFAWDSLPESIQVPPRTALLSLVLRGAKIAQPNRDAKGSVWLQKTVAEEGERLELVVHRRIVDDVPLLLTTRIVLNVSGRNREVVLGRALPAGFVAMSLDSQLPARVEPDSRLRVQVRPGTWTIELVARSEGPVAELKRPAPDGPWREGEEVWVFEARSQLRLVDVEGVAAIDPQQTSLPDEWKRLPAYPLGLGDTLRLVEKRRGNAEPPPDHLTLRRTLWLDFDGRGFTESDRLSGTLRRASRLEMLPPTVLGRVAIAGKDQFITHLEGDAAKTGVELRQGDLDVTAESRVTAEPSDLPAVGWNHDFHEVTASLHLPPGFRLLHATGVDDVSSTWIRHWTLLELFLALVLSIGVWRLFGRGWGALALVTFALTFPESGAPKYVVIFVLLAEAIVRALDRAKLNAGEAPGRGLLLARRAAGLVRAVTATVLVLIALPFLVTHVRHGFSPALDVSLANGGEGEQSGEGGGGPFRLQANKESDAPTTLEATEAPPPPEAEPVEQAAQKLRPGAGGAVGAGGGASDAPTPTDEDSVSTRKSQEEGKIAAALATTPSSKTDSWRGAAPSKGATSYQQLNAHLYDSTSQVQTGPGRPRWSFTVVPLRWSGPVAREQRLHLYLLTPAMNTALAVVRAALVIVLVLLLLPVRPRRSSGKGGGAALSFAVSMFAFVLVVCGFPSSASAQGAPPKELLDELASRMLAKPSCAPTCASSSRMLIEASARRLRLRVEIDASAPTAVPLPGSAQWSPESVLLDGKPARALMSGEDGRLWIAVEKGAHQAIVEGQLPDRELVQLALPLKPHRVEVQAEGWRVDGIHEDGLADDNVQFTRIRDRADGGALEPGVLPPFVQVERTVLVGLDWQVSTRVVRLSPLGTAVVLEVPLLRGESVTTADVRVVAGRALVNMPPQAREVSWRSVLQQQSPVILTAPKSAGWTELWRLDMSPIWHADLSGIAVVQAEPGAPLPTWRPWPGETATLAVSRPGGVVGRTLTIDASSYEVRPGPRATDATLVLELRSSRGGQHVVTLPEGAELESVQINGAASPVRQDGRKVTVPVLPGAQSVAIKWRTPAGMATLFRAAEVDLGAPSVNATTTILVPEGRWVLGVAGPRVGPVVLFWSLLAVLLIASALIGAMRRTPLASWHWMLLAVGLSQVHVAAAAIVALWLHFIAWRERAPDLPSRSFNVRQIGLIVASTIALVILLAAVEHGLLGRPDMQVRGNGSSASSLRWFSDRSEGVIAAPAVVSVPMLVYRGAMLAWALWLALSVVRWLRWGFDAFSAGGMWKRSPRKPPPPPPPMAPPPPMPPRVPEQAPPGG